MERSEILIASTLLLTVYFAQVARPLLQFINGLRISKMLADCWTNFWHRRSEKSCFEVDVEQEILRIRTQNLMLFLAALKHGTGVALLSIVCKRLYGADDLLYSYVQDCLLLAMFFILIIVCSLRLRPNTYTLQISVAAVMLYLGAITYTFSTTYSSMALYALSLTTLVFRVLLVLCHGSISMTFVWNSAYAALTLHMVDDAKAVEENACNDKIGGSLTMQTTVLCELFTLSLLIGLSTWADRFHRSQVTATRLRGEAAASSRLLDLACDVVVPLDGDMRMSAHSKKLAALVALDETIDTKGFQLQRFMPLAEDKKRFEDVLVAACGKTKGSLPCTTHATLRDSFGSHFSVGLYCVAFRDINDCDRFYIGLQESRDVPLAELKSFKRAKKRRRLLFSSTCRGQDHTTSNAQSEDADSDSSEASTLGMDDVLLHPRWQRTDREAQKRGLLTTTGTWNFRLSALTCCPFHAAVEEAARIAYELRKSKCNEHWSPSYSAQCSECGVLADWEEVCDDCECPSCNRFTMSRGLRSQAL
eukprot:TRINITY_DN26647_c0_g2_i2.p1 TRINITY_DN26647_c0_g2~~TRINITY_DN26647_c0_g2_i2.p1  ORF type:complete len:533 (-),score=41.48 TRINITY_DN26647_c0_g2_i2:87-1685(-)